MQASRVEPSLTDVENYCEYIFIPALEGIYQPFRKIQRLFSKTEMAIDEDYINLAVVTSKEQREKEQGLKEEALTARYRADEGDSGIYTRIYLPKEEISLEQLFNLDRNIQKISSPASSSAKRLLIEGRVGIGKSTLVKYLVYQWSQRKVASKDSGIQALRNQLKTQFSGIVLISLRHINRYTLTEKVTLIDLLCNQDGFNVEDSAVIDAALKAYDKSQQPLLYILDGWDELSSSIWKESSPRSKLLKNLLEKSAWLITSRPGQVPQEIKREAHLELLGFSASNVERYIYSYFDNNHLHSEDFIKRLLAFVKKPMIAGMTHIPINLELLCYVVENKPEILNLERGISLAELYYEIVAHLVQRYHEEKTSKSVGIDYTETLVLNEQLWSSYGNSISCLEAVGFEATKRYEFLFCFTHPIYNQILIDNSLQSADVASYNLAVIKFEALALFQEPDMVFVFTNLTIDEFREIKKILTDLCQPHSQLALDSNIISRIRQSKEEHCEYKKLAFTSKETESLYLFLKNNNQETLGKKLLTNKKTDIKNLLAQSYYFVHLSFQEFFAACHLFKSLCSQKESTRETALNWIAENKYFLRYRSTIAFLVNLLYLNKNTPLTLIKNILGLNAVDSVLLVDYLIHARKSFWFAVLEKYVDIVGLLQMELLIFLGNHMGDAIEQMPVYYALCDLAAKIIDDAMLNSRNFLYKQENWWFERLCMALHSSLPHLNQRILSQFISKLRSHDIKIKKAAFKIVPCFGFGATTHEILKEVLVALKNQDSEIQNAALEVIKGLGPTALSTAVLQELLVMLRQNSDRENKSAALYVVEMLGPNAAISEILKELLSALQSQDDKIQEGALSAIISLGSAAATSEILQYLPRVFQSQDENIQYKALGAVGMLGPKAATSEILKEVLRVLQSKDIDTDAQEEALHVVKMLGPAALIQEILKEVFIALKSWDSDIRSVAFDILNNLDDTLISRDRLEEMLSEVLNQDKESSKKQLDFEMKSRSETVRSENLELLRKQLQSQDQKVQQSALHMLRNALQIPGSTVLEPEILRSLAVALQSSNNDILKVTLEIIAQIGSAAAIPEILEALSTIFLSRYRDIYLQALHVVEKLGPIVASSEKILNELQIALQTEDSEIRNIALDVLNTLGSAAATKEILHNLLVGLRSSDSYIRWKTLNVVKSMGPIAATQGIVEELSIILQDQNKKNQEQVFDVVKSLGSATSLGILPALFVVSQSSDLEIQNAAFNTIGYLDCTITIKYLKEILNVDIYFYLKLALNNNALLLYENNQEIFLLNIYSGQQYKLFTGNIVSNYKLMLDNARPNMEHRNSQSGLFSVAYDFTKAYSHFYPNKKPIGCNPPPESYVTSELRTIVPNNSFWQHRLTKQNPDSNTEETSIKSEVKLAPKVRKEFLKLMKRGRFIGASLGDMLSNADLEGSIFTRCDLFSSNLSHSDLKNAKFIDCTYKKLPLTIEYFEKMASEKGVINADSITIIKDNTVVYNPADKASFVSRASRLISDEMFAATITAENQQKSESLKADDHSVAGSLFLSRTKTAAAASNKNNKEFSGMGLKKGFLGNL